MSGDMHTLAHAQFGSWACTSQNEVRGDVHTSVHAQCGSWRDVYSSAHAQYWSWNVVELSDQPERWGQCNLRYPPTASAKLGPDVQGGVVDSRGRFGGLGPRDLIRAVRQTRERARTRDGSTVSY